MDIKPAIERLNEALQQEPLFAPYTAASSERTTCDGVTVGDTSAMILGGFMLETPGVRSITSCVAVFINDGDQYTRILISGYTEDGEPVNLEVTHDGGS